MSLIGDSSSPHFHDPDIPGSATAAGRIGQVSWALVERGDGFILTFRRYDKLLEIPIDTPAEQAALRRLVAGIIGVLPTGRKR